MVGFGKSAVEYIKPTVKLPNQPMMWQDEHSTLRAFYYGLCIFVVISCHLSKHHHGLHRVRLVSICVSRDVLTISKINNAN